MGADTGHRAGTLKQANKPHKTGRHRSKGAISVARKGKVSIKTMHKKAKQIVKKEQRRNQANQLRKNKRHEMLEKRRGLGGHSQSSAPFLITIIPLQEDIDPLSALTILENCDENTMVTKSETGVTHIVIPRFKHQYSFIIPPRGRGFEFQILDCLKGCDTTMFLLSATAADNDNLIDRWGDRILSMAMAQGIPTPLIALMDLQSVAPKRRIQTKATIQKFITNTFPNEKLMQLDTNSDALNVLRRIGEQKQNKIYNKSNRPHLCAERYEFIEDPTGDTGTLKIYGYLRGIPLKINNLVHIPGLGEDHLIKNLYSLRNTSNPNKLRYALDEFELLAQRDIIDFTILASENVPDEMNVEQSFPSKEEIEESQKSTKKLIKRIPKGMSDYQACWIPDIEVIDENPTDNNSDSDDIDDDESEEDEDYMSCHSELNSEDEFDKDNNDEDDDLETFSIAETTVDDAKYDQNMDIKEELDTWQKIKQSKIDQQFPDEIDTPVDVLARKRFEKYRGLESFRTSPWDVKENLPFDYSRIFQFKDFDRYKRRILKDEARVKNGNEENAAMPGSFICLDIPNVSTCTWKQYITSNSLVILYGILPHEHKMCVANAILRRAPNSTIPIKSKETIIIQCGYRRFIVNPIYSAHTNGDKHKYERYFRSEDTVVATFYAKIQFPPAPVLCFQQNPDKSIKLVANGSLLNCNPDRIVLKRIVLSGHPFKINRKTATIRYMFYNKEDIEYFRPIKLRTKCGRLGHIKESLGTHGHAKCVFDGQLKSFDTVFLYLYKRIFPKWTYEEMKGYLPGKNNDQMSLS